VILKRRFAGAESRLLLGDGTAGGPFELQASQTLGHDWGGGSLLLALEHYARDNLTADDRPYTRSTDLRPLGGTDHRAIYGSPGNILRSVNGVSGPGWAIPAGRNGVGLTPADFVAGAVNFGDIAPDSDVLPRQVRESAYAALNQEIGRRLTFSADGRYSRRRFGVALNAPTSLLTVNTANPFFVSPNGSASHQIYYSFGGDLPLPRLKGSAESLGGTAGLDLRLPADWRLTAYAAFAQETSRTATTGILNATALSEALGTTADRPDTAFSARRDGFFNPFGDGGDNPRAVLDFIGSGYTRAVTRSRVTSADAMADGSLFRLRGAPVRAALGVNARKESYDRRGESFTSGAAPTLGRPTVGDRDVIALYGELRIPLAAADDPLGALEASLAGRFERYSDFGETTNPKLGLVWTPHRDVRVRASYGTSFRAPALPELIEAPLNSPTFLNRNGVRTLTLIQYGGNPDLGPETARAFTGGIDLSPQGLPGLRLSLNAFDIRFKDRIDQPVRVSISTALNDPTVASFITFLSPATSPADLQRITALLADPATITSQGVFPPESYGAIVDARYVNTASLRVRGADLQAGYAFARGENRFDLQLNASWIADYVRQVTPSGPKVDRAGVLNAPPKLKVRTTAAWRRDWWDVQLGLNYAPAYQDIGGTRLRSHLTADLQLRAAAPEGSRLAGLSAILNVRNLFDRDPPFYDGANGLPYDAGNADIVGRYVSLQLVKAW
jgi:iron complex outermembrane receptor protein